MVLSSGAPDSSTNKTDPHDIAEILLKVVLSHKPNRISCINSLSIELTIMFNYITHNPLDRI
jgi:hypothetical protein